MKYRTLGKTGLKVSEVGMGTWQGDWVAKLPSTQDLQTATLEKAILAAVG